MPLFGGSNDKHFDRLKFTTALKMATSRLSMQKNKKENQVKAQRREIAELLRAGKDESARIKVEAALRDQYMVEGLEILQLFIDLLNTRQQLIIESTRCPTDMKEAISTVIWATPRVENVPEMLTIRDQLARKFGREFAQKASENLEAAVNQRTLFRLSMQVPEPYLCVQCMHEIAQQFQVEWTPKPELGSDPIHGLGSGTGTLPDPTPNYPHGMGPGMMPSAPPPPSLPAGYIPGPPPAAPMGGPGYYDAPAGLPPPILPGHSQGYGAPAPGAIPPVPPPSGDGYGDGLPKAKEAAPLPPPMPDPFHGHGKGGAGPAGGDYDDLQERLAALRRGPGGAPPPGGL